MISVVTYGELAYPARKSPDSLKALKILDGITELIPVVPMATDVADAYGQIRADLSARGALIGNNGLWIAAHAKSLDITLVTNNEKEFQRVGGLTLENWANG